MNFTQLSQTIQFTHQRLQAETAKAINLNLTIRNWLIGLYIVEFEQKGEDRAVYGAKLISKLAIQLNHKSLSAGNLKLFRQFYFAYRHLETAVLKEPATIRLIGQSPIGQLQDMLVQISQSPIGQLKETHERIGQSPIGQFQSTENQLVNSGKLPNETHSDSLLVPAELLLKRLSYTHLVQLMPIDNLLKRSFYEVECIKGTWSVSALKRQIHSLLYERTGLSRKPEQLVSRIEDTSPMSKPMDIIKSVYAFEFLDIAHNLAVEESELETALLDHLQEFLLEMGRGFCLEARQLKILIGDEYFFIDLVFYHRLLKCHVLIDLKMGAFSHNDAGQLNTYLNYYKAEVTPPEDNPPVGILLVTHKNHALVQYATAGMDNHLFVSKYLVQLPDTAQLQTFIQEELKRL